MLPKGVKAAIWPLSKRLVIVPDKNEIPGGTLLSILSQAGLTKEEFLNALEHL